jgi:hypothetical protein
MCEEATIILSSCQASHFGLTWQLDNMKTCAAAILLFFCSLLPAFSQPKQCYSYDYLKAERRVWSYLFRGDNFEYLSDDLLGHEVFNTKHELANKGTFIPIPVLRLDLSRIIAPNDSLQVNSLYTTDYSAFTGFLMNREQLANLIVSGASQQLNSKRIDNMGALDSALAFTLYDLFKSKKACFFYDKPRFRYAYFEDNRYVYYDSDNKKFVALNASQCLADYKYYFNIK